MTNEDIKQELLQAVAPVSRSPDLVTLRWLTPEPDRTSANDRIRPDTGEKDVPAGAGRIPLAEELAILTREITDLRRVAQGQIESLESNTQATLADGLLRAATTGVTGVMNSTASSLIEKGSVLSPLVSGVLGLFRDEPRKDFELVRSYVSPSPVSIEAAIDGSGSIQGASYGAYDLPRAIGRHPQMSVPPITIQVQAFDSRSFADHSDEIAKAVREAILTGHGLTDVLGEL